MPPSWSLAAYPSSKPLSGWLLELQQRLDFFAQWIHTGRPAAFWLGAFFNPSALLAAALHLAAGARQVSADRLSFSYELKGQMRSATFTHGFAAGVRPAAEPAGTPPAEGAARRPSRSEGALLEALGADDVSAIERDTLYVHGLFLEGARWDAERGVLAEARRREPFAPLPLIALRPTVDRQPPHEGVYICPVFKTPARVDQVTPSGQVMHNFVTSLELPSDDSGRLAPSKGGDVASWQLGHSLSPHWVRRGVAALLSLPE